MKKCPQCKRVYDDETLKFCLDDGTSLLYGPSSVEPATQMIPSPHATSEDPTRSFRSGDIPQESIRTSIPSVSETQGRSNTKLWLATVGAAVFILAGGFFGYRYFSSAAPGQIASIAVMPLVNANGDADSEYLSDGMTETLINSLSQLPNLAVKGRGSVFRYKGKDVEPKQIATELGVQAVLSGRLLKRGDSVTLSLDLVEASTGTQIWGEQYVRTINEIASLQKEIARDVSNKLKTKLSGTDQQNMAKGHTADPEAYQLYLQGLYLWNQRTFDSAGKARELFQKAIDKDPKYALAYVGLANGYIINDRPAEHNIKAKAAALKALELDPSLGEAHAILGNVAFYFEWDFPRSEAEFKKAIELNPNYPTAHHWYGETLAALGRFDESNAEYARAAELDPVSMAILTDQGMAFNYARQFDRAIEHFKKLLEIDPKFVRTHYYLSNAYEAKGMFDEAIESRKKGVLLDGADPVRAEASTRRMLDAVKTSGLNGYWQTQMELSTEGSKRNGEPVDQMDVAVNHANLGNADKAFEALERAFKDRRVGLVFLKVDYLWDKIRSDPRFADLIRRVGLP
ncbi:MAG: tetratricopeptide repeat protein [Pyrinomonadaceae bacterium]